MNRSRPKRMDELKYVYETMARHRDCPETWKITRTETLATDKCLCIFTFGKWRLMPHVWQDLQAWMEPLRDFGIVYDVSGKDGGRLHFTLHQCSGFSDNPTKLYDGSSLNTLLADLAGLQILFRGLLVTPTGIALRGFPSTNKDVQKLMEVRNRLQSAFEDAKIPFEPPYMNDICHSTLFRWTKPPTEPIIQYIQREIPKWEHALLAEMLPFEWHLGYGSLTMKENEVNILNSYWTPLIIAHRGLTNGPDAELENNQERIQRRSEAGRSSEIDIWWKDDSFWIGHDAPYERVTKEFLCMPYLWIHAKHVEAFYQLQRVANESGVPLRIFYHTDEDYVLTTCGDTIIYPGLLETEGWVYMMPETCSGVVLKRAYAICTDVE